MYRKGIGRGGALKARQLSLLMTRPLGVKSVANPLPTDGGFDPQHLQDARRNAPTTVLTLDRVVSLQDYEDFARAFSGVAKALATWTWNAQARCVLLTVAGVGGDSHLLDDTTRDRLRDAVRALGNPLINVDVKSYVPRTFKVSGTVFVDADRQAKQVEIDVRSALTTAFSFESRSFGQAVTLSEVEAVIQNVRGVAFIDIDTLFRGSAMARDHYVPSHKPANGAARGLAQPAELLTLDHASLLDLTVVPAPR